MSERDEEGPFICCVCGEESVEGDTNGMCWNCTAAEGYDDTPSLLEAAETALAEFELVLFGMAHEADCAIVTAGGRHGCSCGQRSVEWAASELRSAILREYDREATREEQGDESED